MISLNINDTKNFMSHLLIKDTFDNFLLNEAHVLTGNSYTIDGTVNKSFYTSEELDNICEKYSYWRNIKPFCFSLIKGNKVPTSMKYVFSLTSGDINEIYNSCDTSLEYENISGLYINLKYNDSGINIITGISLNIFSLDKAVEKAFDSYIKNFFDKAGITYEEI